MVALRVAAYVGAPFNTASILAEGGAIETDGGGTPMAKAICILYANRNPDMTRARTEAGRRAAYGASKVIWFPGIVGRDITDDHVDSTSRFLGGHAGPVISAQFGDSHADADAKATLAALFPGRTVVQLNIDNLGAGGGGVHCVTQPQPKP